MQFRSRTRPSPNHPSMQFQGGIIHLPSPPPRSLVVIDVENMIINGPDQANDFDFQDAIARVAGVADIQRTDHVFIGVGSNRPEAVFSCRTAWPTAAIRCLSGADGADRALSQLIVDEAMVQRSYDRVVVASGDHHFAEPVGELHRLGVHTVVLSWREKLSAQLRHAASEVRYITNYFGTQPNEDKLVTC